MTACAIGFRNRERLVIEVSSVAELIEGIIGGLNKSPNSPVQWYAEKSGALLNISEITYILPLLAIVEDSLP